MADLNFVSDEVENAQPMNSFEPLPAGKYTAVVIESEMKETGGGTGQQLALKWQIIDGDYEGRYVFDRITLRNANAQAVEIGLRSLKSLALAVGHQGKLSDSAELHGTPCSIKLKVTPPRTDPKTGKTYDAGNAIQAYESLGDVPVTTQQTAAVASAPARTAAAPARAVAPATPARKPWERKPNPAN